MIEVVGEGREGERQIGEGQKLIQAKIIRTFKDIDRKVWSQEKDEPRTVEGGSGSKVSPVRRRTPPKKEKVLTDQVTLGRMTPRQRAPGVLRIKSRDWRQGWQD